ncbi:MAG: hypothetical protein ABIU58_04095 [Ramlibacter sp.]
MSLRPLQALFHVSLALVFGVCLSGCAGPGDLVESRETSLSAGSMKARGMTPQQAFAAVAVERSNRADVAAALGPAIVIPFDSGYEVWVYRWKGAQKTMRGDTELVILFDRSGLAKKTRIRPPYDERRG